MKCWNWQMSSLWTVLEYSTISIVKLPNVVPEANCLIWLVTFKNKTKLICSIKKKLKFLFKNNFSTIICKMIMLSNSLCLPFHYILRNSFVSFNLIDLYITLPCYDLISDLKTQKNHQLSNHKIRNFNSVWYLVFTALTFYLVHSFLKHMKHIIELKLLVFYHKSKQPIRCCLVVRYVRHSFCVSEYCDFLFLVSFRDCVVVTFRPPFSIQSVSVSYSWFVVYSLCLYSISLLFLLFCVCECMPVNVVPFKSLTRKR